MQTSFRSCPACHGQGRLHISCACAGGAVGVDDDGALVFERPGGDVRAPSRPGLDADTSVAAVLYAAAASLTERKSATVLADLVGVASLLNIGANRMLEGTWQS